MNKKNYICRMLTINHNHLQAYGLKFIINVEGLARKFSLKNTVLNVGNGLALLGITTLICEFILTYFIKISNSCKHLFNKNKVGHRNKSPPSPQQYVIFGGHLRKGGRHVHLTYHSYGRMSDRVRMPADKRCQDPIGVSAKNKGHKLKN